MDATVFRLRRSSQSFSLTSAVSLTALPKLWIAEDRVSAPSIVSLLARVSGRRRKEPED